MKAGNRPPGILLALLGALGLAACAQDLPLPDEQYDTLNEPVLSQETAWSFRFPTANFVGGSYNRRDFLNPANHLGEDSTQLHFDPVYAAANGVVRQVRRGNSQGYGSVVVIEHRLPDGVIVQTIYGHLCNHAGHQIPINIGYLITKGELLGYIGSGDENGDGGVHLHLGLRRGAYDGVYCGYTGPGGCAAANFHDPTNFITPRRNGLVLSAGVTLAPAAPVARANITFSYTIRDDGYYGGNFEFRAKLQSSNGATTFYTCPTVARWLNPGSTTTLTFTRALNAAGNYRVLVEARAPGTETWWPTGAAAGAVNPRSFIVR